MRCTAWRATGLVLTYKTSGVFNFAYGSVAAMGVFVFYWLNVQEGLPWGLAAAICVFVLAPVEGLLLELLGRILENQGTAVKVVATIGLLLIVLGVGGIWYGSLSGATVPQYLPSSSFSLGGVNVTWGEFIVFAVAVLAAAALYYFFRTFRLGMAMRGIVDVPELIDLNGENPTRVRRWAWIIGTVFATVAGLLISPSLGLDATVITLLVVSAFGAAAIGYFESLPLTFIGGLVIGLLTSFGAKYSVEVSWLGGLPGRHPFHRPLPRSDIHTGPEAGRSASASRLARASVMERSPSRPFAGWRSRPGRLRRDSAPARDGTHSLDQRGDRHPALPLRRSAGPDVRADLSVPVHLLQPLELWPSATSWATGTSLGSSPFFWRPSWLCRSVRSWRFRPSGFPVFSSPSRPSVWPYSWAMSCIRPTGCSASLPRASTPRNRT